MTTEEETSRTCPKCKKVLPSNAKFCHGCGYNLSAPENITCPSCREQLPADAAFCFNCGKSLDMKTEETKSVEDTKSPATEPIVVNIQNEGTPKTRELPITSWGKVVTGEKSTFLAVLLGFFISGTGVMYAGRVGLGIVIFVLTILTALFLVGIIIWIYGMYKAYTMCKENNRLWLEYQMGQ